MVLNYSKTTIPLLIAPFNNITDQPVTKNK